MRLTTAKLELALHPAKDLTTNGQPYTERLNAIGLDTILDMMDHGYKLHTREKASVQGILNILGVPPHAFNTWLRGFPESKQIAFSTVSKSQLLSKKNEMVEIIEESISELEKVGDDMNAYPTDVETAPVKTKTAKDKAALANKLLDSLSKADQENQRSKGGGNDRELHVHVYAPEGSQDKLRQLRKAKEITNAE